MKFQDKFVAPYILYRNKYYIYGKMPKEESLPENPSIVKDVKNCAEKTLSLNDLYKKYCLAAAIEYTGKMGDIDHYSDFEAYIYNDNYQNI